MRVLHLIPDAFEYFTDIRANAFELVEALGRTGITVEAVTIGFGAVTRAKRNAVARAAPSRVVPEPVAWPAVVTALGAWDIVHVHAPMLGAIPQVLQWKNARLRGRLAVTVHRNVRITDLFSVYIACYSRWWLPRLRRAADLLLSGGQVVDSAQLAGRYTQLLEVRK